MAAAHQRKKKRTGGLRGTFVVAVFVTFAVVLSYNSPKSLYSAQQLLDVALSTSAAEKSSGNDVILPRRNKHSTRAGSELEQPPMTETAKRYFEDKNKTIAYITFGHFTPNAVWRFQSLILDALTTWLRDDIIYFVLNYHWRGDFERECAMPEHVHTCQHVVPIYVNCTEGHYGPSPNCKMDQGMTVMWNLYSGHYDWFSYQDDDMHVKTPYLNDFVKGLSPRDPMTLACKNPRRLGFQNECILNNPDFTYMWGQPVIYSRAALRLVAPGLAMGAVSKQGAEFRVTHDVANPLVHWMYGIPNVYLPFWCEPDVPTRFGNDNSNRLIIHGIGRVHDTKRQAPASVFNDEVYRVFGSQPHPEPPYNYIVHKPQGFWQTQTYHLYGNASSWTKEWNTMPVSDCQNITHPLGTPSLAKTSRPALKPQEEDGRL